MATTSTQAQREMQAIIKSLEEALERKDAIIESLREDNRKTQKDKCTMLKAHNKKAGALDRKVAESIEDKQKLREANNQIATLKRKLREANTKNMHLQFQLGTFRQDLDQTKDILESLIVGGNKKGKDTELKGDKVDSQDAEIAKKNAKIAGLKKEIAALKSDLVMMKDVVKRFQAMHS